VWISPKHFFDFNKLREDFGLCRTFGDKMALWGATGGGLGYFKMAPGTWGSLPGIPLGICFSQVSADRGELWPVLVLVVAILVGIFAAFLSISRTERLLGLHDEPRIVADEVIGQAIALCSVSPTLLNLLIGFLLFRVLDILKPGPIGSLDRDLAGPWGTLLDDVVAGGVAALVLISLQIIGLLDSIP
jgi:phosphatidylglycerophosphatase A